MVREKDVDARDKRGHDEFQDIGFVQKV